MKCIIVEDDTMSRKALEQIVNQTEQLMLANSFGSSIEAYNYLSKNPVDLVFLDIEMPEMSGLQLLSNLPVQPFVIFTTGKKEYAIEAFDYKAIDYLVKPIEYPRFLKAIIKAKELHENKHQHAYVPYDEKQYIFLKEDGVFIKINFKDIIFIEALGDYITVHTAAKKHTIHITMKGIENKLPGNFLRVHRSFIVNTGLINSIEDSTISINGHLIPIGVSYRSEVYKKLQISS